MFTATQFLRVVYAFAKAHLQRCLYTVDWSKVLTHTVTHTRKCLKSGGEDICLILSAALFQIFINPRQPISVRSWKPIER